MKGFRFFIGGFVLALIFSALAFAQTEQTKNTLLSKIAVIDTDAFDNKETGIKEIVEAYDKLESEFKPQAEELKIIAEKIQKFQKELEAFQNLAEKFKGICVPDEINKKFEDYDKLTKEYQQRQDEIKSLYDKCKPAIFADVYKKVGDAIKQFSKEKGYVLIVDISKSNEHSMIAEDEATNITVEFIKYYNENFAKTELR